MDLKSMIILTGPTAVGKTALSLRLAKAVDGEIISADSMQVYRHMDIGTAKITQNEMRGVRHHLIDILDPAEEFNVAVFQKYCREALEEIYASGHIPILTGGTGFYIQAVLKDIDFAENEADSERRKMLEKLALEKGTSFLYERLKEADPAAAEQIHENNRKRIIRALEFYELTGQKISEHNEREKQKPPAYRFCYFVLNDERQKLYNKIEKRVDQMMENGLVDEVRALKKDGYTKDMVSMQGIGYKEILDYLDQEITLEEAVYRIKQNTRHFAKRQITWFKREQNVIWVNKDEFRYDEDRILAFMLEQIRKKGIL